MKILLTGGTGMVGKNILEHKPESSAEFIAPSREDLDLFDYLSVKQFIEDCKPDMVVHSAGHVGGIQANIANPVAFLLKNLDMGRNVVLASRECGIKKLINLGSSCMYPRNFTTPLKEEMVLKGELEPTNEGYAIAKIAVSRLCSYISKENPDYKYKTLIPCNLYGRWDKFSPEHSHMIPAVIRKLHEAKVKGINTIDIWGDGTARREFLYAGDVADCIHRAVSHFDSLPELMNIGLGGDYSVNDYYSTVAEVVGYTGAFTHDLSKPAGMARKLVDVSRLSDWGWRPKTPLKDGIAATYEFFKANYGDKK